MPSEQPGGDGFVRRFDLRSFNEMQLREMERHKWIESEKAGRDLGEDAVFDWVRRYAVSFRAAYGSMVRWETPMIER